MSADTPFKEIVAIDMDEVLCCFVKKVLDRWNTIHGTSFKREQIDMFRMEDTLETDPKKRETAAIIIGAWINEPGFFSDLEWMPGAEAGIKQLISDPRFEVFILTSIGKYSDGEGAKGKIEWLKKNLPEFDRQKLVFASDKSIAGCNVMLDDAVHNIETSRAQYPIVFTAPWNRNYKNAHFRVNSWDEFLEFIDHPQCSFERVVYFQFYEKQLEFKF